MAYFDKYGAEFSDDKKDLMEVPKNYSGVYEIPQGTTGVYWDAFKNCSKISAIVIPSSVDEFYDDFLDSINVFSTCKKLTHFIVDSQNKTCFTIDGVLCEKKTNVILAYPYAKVGEFLLPENILLTDSAEEGWQGALTTSPYIITRIQINDTNPNYVVKDGALYNRSMDILIKVSPDITQYIMPDSVKMIANCAFFGCNKLRKIVFGSSLSDISSQELTLAEQLRDCKNLSSLIVSEFNSNYYSNKHGFVYYNDYENFINDRLVYFPPAKRIKKCVIPASTQSIAFDAFENCTHIESFSLDNDSYGSHYIDTIDQDTAIINQHAFDHTAFYSNKENWKDGLLYIDNILIRVSDDYAKPELIIPSGIDVITENSITSPNIESIIFEDGIEKFNPNALACPNIRTIKFPKTLSVYYLERGGFGGMIRWIPRLWHEFKYLEKILIPQGMRDFFLMYSRSSCYQFLMEYNDSGDESPIMPISDAENEFYHKIHIHGFPNYFQYTAVKRELSKGVALSYSQIYNILDNLKEVGCGIKKYWFLDILSCLEECFKRDGITIKTIKHKNNDGKVENLYYVDSQNGR